MTNTPQPPSAEELRRTRLQCFLAAVIFAACAVGLLFAPVEMQPAVRYVAAGFNLVIAIAVFLYGRSLGKAP